MEACQGDAVCFYAKAKALYLASGSKRLFLKKEKKRLCYDNLALLNQ